MTVHHDGVHYHVKELPGARGQLHADVVLDGQLDHSYRIGTPAPLATVLAAAEMMNRFAEPDAAERT